MGYGEMRGILNIKMNLWLLVLATGFAAVYAVNYKCYTYTTKDINDMQKRTEKRVCERYQNHTYTGGDNANYKGCGTCSCCQVKGCYPWNEKKYIGTWSFSQNGIECQRWDSQSPHEHNLNTNDKFKKDGNVTNAQNYCRDPDGEGFLWCYTTSPEVRYAPCGIPRCSVEEFNTDCYTFTAADKAKVNDPDAGISKKDLCESYDHHTHTSGKNADFPGCGKCGCCQERGCYADTIKNYNGTFSLTKSGRTCQRWDSKSPHKHSRNKDRQFPEDGSASAAQNYCRDPDGSGYLWCYTTDPKRRWEGCDIFKCQPKEEEEEEEEEDLTAHCSFSTYLNNDYTVDSLKTVPYDKVNLNDCGAYDTSTGRYRAPVTGVYRFSWTALTYWDTLDLQLTKNVSTGLRRYSSAVADASYGTSPGGNTVIVKLEKGTEVYIRVMTGSYIPGARYFTEMHVFNTFSGTMLYPSTDVKPAFSVFLNKDLSAGTNMTTSVVMYNTIVLNEGKGYCAETGHFTAPEDGVYLLTYVAGGISQDTVMLQLHVDGVISTEVAIGGQEESYIQGGNTLIIRMKKGSAAWVQISKDTANFSFSSDTMRLNTFSGYMISK